MLNEFLEYYTEYLKNKSQLEPYHIERIYGSQNLYIWDLPQKDFVKSDRKKMIWLDSNLKYLEFIAESRTNILLFFNGNSRSKIESIEEFFIDVKQEIMSVIFTKEDKEIYKTVNAYIYIEVPNERETKNFSNYFDTKYTEGKFFVSILNTLDCRAFSKLREIHSSKENIPNTHYLLEDLVEKIYSILKGDSDLFKLYIVDSLRKGKDTLEVYDIMNWLFDIRELEIYEFDNLKNSLENSSEKLALEKVNKNIKHKYVWDNTVQKEVKDIFYRYLLLLINEVKINGRDTGYNNKKL